MPKTASRSAPRARASRVPMGLPSRARYRLRYLAASSNPRLDTSVTKSISRLAQECHVQWTQRQSAPGTVLVTLSGLADAIDSVHDRIGQLEATTSWINEQDSLGDAIRVLGYPLLADIELALRVFIKRAMIEVLGPNWWGEVIPPELREKSIQPAKRPGQIQHPLDWLTFEQLMSVFSAEYVEWAPNRLITSSDLLSLLELGTDLSAMRAEARKRVKPFALWDDCFGKYFTNGEAWHLQKSFIERQVVPFRNAVMHHRPVRLHHLVAVQSGAGELLTLLQAARPRLAKPSKTSVQKQFPKSLQATFRDWGQSAAALAQALSASDSALASLAASAAGVQSAVARAKLLQDENLREALQGANERLMRSFVTNFRDPMPDFIRRVQGPDFAAISRMTSASLNLTGLGAIERMTAGVLANTSVLTQAPRAAKAEVAGRVGEDIPPPGAESGRTENEDPEEPA